MGKRPRAGRNKKAKVEEAAGEAHDTEEQDDEPIAVDLDDMVMSRLHNSVDDAGVDSDDEDAAQDVTTPARMHLAKTTSSSKHLRQKVLVCCSRGATVRYRHLMLDFLNLLPHGAKESKLDTKDQLYVLNEVAEMRNCNSAIFFEVRKKKDLYLWISKTPSGPSVKFHAQNVHTMDELNMAGNCLKGARPFLYFAPEFDGSVHWSLIKELLAQLFGTPKDHRKVKPFYDHMFSFYILDDRIWFRNFQIVEKEGQKMEKNAKPVLVEIGPRFVLNPIRVFSGSFCGQTLFENPRYVSPNAIRSMTKKKDQHKYNQRVSQKKKGEDHKASIPMPDDPLNEISDIWG